jgi:hypothetical protein
MIYLIYMFLMNGQPMVGMAEFDTYQRCVEQGIPRAKEQYPNGDAYCFIVKN